MIASETWELLMRLFLAESHRSTGELAPFALPARPGYRSYSIHRQDTPTLPAPGSASNTRSAEGAPSDLNLFLQISRVVVLIDLRSIAPFIQQRLRLCACSTRSLKSTNAACGRRLW